MPHVSQMRNPLSMTNLRCEQSSGSIFVASGPRSVTTHENGWEFVSGTQTLTPLLALHRIHALWDRPSSETDGGCTESIDRRTQRHTPTVWTSRDTPLLVHSLVLLLGALLHRRGGRARLCRSRLPRRRHVLNNRCDSPVHLHLDRLVELDRNDALDRGTDVV